MSTDQLNTLISRLESVTTRLENVSLSSGGVGGGGSEGVSVSVQAYDDIINTQLAELVAVSNKIGGDVITQMNLFKELFLAQREFLVVASKCKKPSDTVVQALVKAQADKLMAVQEFRESRRTSTFFNFLSAVSEVVAGLGWVLIAPTPAPYLKESLDAGMFYMNRVLKDRSKDPSDNAAAWVKSLKGLFESLHVYVKSNHTTGVTWNPRGEVATAGTGPPPPPPALDTGAAVKPAVPDSKTQLFSQLNKGADITSGLKRVTDDEKVHKNPALRLGPKPYTPSAAPKPTSAAAKQTTPTPAKAQPMCVLDRKKWRVEFQSGNRDIVLSETHLQHVVYIYKCEQSTVQVKGKVNSICIDQCKKTAVVFEDVVCAVDVINSTSIQAQSMGKMPTLNIDKTDGIQVYLSPASLNVHIITAKSSEMNVLVPNEGGDYTECPIPEQFQTTWNGTKLVTTTAGHSG